MDNRKSKKKPELIDQLYVGNYIDVYHNSGKQYRLAYILSKNEKEIEVTYDGLSKKENETFKLQSNKLQFARRFTQQAYTGDDYRGGKTQRDYLKYSNEECQKYIKEIKDIIANNCQNMSAIEITQTIRVRHFIWLDNILSSEFTIQSIPVALEYIKCSFQFIKWYFEIFPRYFGDYVKGVANQELYLTDEKVAIANCYAEVFEMYSMLFGSIWRVLKPENSFFYLNYDQLMPIFDKVFPPPIFNGFTQNPYIPDWKLYPGATDLVKCIKKTFQFYIKMMSYFKNIGGLTAWEGLLKQYEGEYNYFPLKHCMFKYTLTAQYLASLYPSAEQASMAQKLIDWFGMRVKTISIQEIKDTEIDTVRDCVQDMSYLFTKGFTLEQITHWLDEIQLELALKFLKSPYLEKRVKGISEIKEFTEKIRAETIGTKIRTSIQKDYLAKWVKENKILELSLLGDSVHPELIKRCSEIAVFLCKNNAFSNDMIDKIWTQNIDKHESTQLALFEFFKVVCSYLNFEGIDKLYQHISSIPYSKYNDNVVMMIKGFTEAALSQKFNQQQINYQPIEKRFMTFNQLWYLLQDREENQVPAHIQEQCFSAVRHLVSNIPQTKQFLHQYFGKCFELIGNHTSVYQAISCVHYILDKQFKEDPNGKKQLIKQTDQKYNIIELFVKDIEVYMEKIRNYFKDQPPTDIVIWGVQTYQQNIFFRLQMLNYLLTQSELKISYEQIIRLWDTLCVKTQGSIQKKEFNKIIIGSTYESINTTFIQTYFDKENGYKFFTQVLCNPQMNNYRYYTQEDYDLFYVFFKQFNSNNKILRFFGNTVSQTNLRIIVMDLNIEGKNALWEIFSKVEDQTIIEQISNLLITLHTSLSNQIANKAEKVQQELMDKCLHYINQQCPTLTSRSIKLLNNLFNVFQSGPAYKKALKSTNHHIFKACIIYGQNDQKQQEFREGDTMTVHHWKSKLAEELGVAYKQLDIFLDNRPIESSYDVTETYIKDVFLPYAQLKVIVNNKFHPKNYLSQDSSTFENLFRLLNNQESVEFQVQVWDLINKLPINAEVQQRVYYCKDWKQFLDHQFFDMFYVLQIIQKQLDDQQWTNSFVNSDGIALVTQKFLGLQLDFVSCPLEKNCCLTYLEVLNVVNYRINEEQIKEQIRNKILIILKSLCKDIQINKKQQGKVEPKLLRMCFQLLSSQKNEQDKISQCLKAYVRDSELPNSLSTLFLEHDNIDLKKEYHQQLLQLRGTTESQLILKAIFDSVLEIVVNQNKQKSEHFFQFTCELLQLEKFEIKIDQSFDWIISKLKEQNFNEQTHKDHDQILIGLLKIVNVFLEKYPYIRTRPGLFKEILSYVFESEVDVKCKCKSTQSRQAAFQCLLTLLQAQDSMQTFYEAMVPLHGTNVWRTRHQIDWNIQSKFHEKSSTGFVGLYNLGCICYMNSLLQQLYMVPQFREPLLQIQEQYEGPEEENLLHQLKCLFLALKYSQKQYHTPKKFCHSFKDFEGNPTNIFEQMDVDEFCNLLMDRIEACIKGTQKEDLVKKIFGGVMSNEIIGKTCPHYSEREEPFFAVPLPVANKKNLEECLSTLVQGDTLEGENAYYCEQCKKKVNALKRMCLKKLPNHLILVLKRFNFDFDLMAKAKLNDRIEFPSELDLEAYSQQGLRRKENRDPENEEYPSEYYQYRLSGVVIHLGSADSGHYYSFIQDRFDQQKWYEFNDIFVSQTDFREVISDGYGGVDKMSRMKYAPQFKDKSKSAYMLFYERVKPIPQEQPQTMEVEQLTQESVQFLEEIKDENRKFQIQRFIFSPEYFNFMSNLIKIQLEQPSNDVIKALVYFYLSCAVRENDKSFITNNIQNMCDLLAKAPKVCEWIIECFTLPIYIKEFQLECSKKVVRKYVITLIITAMTYNNNDEMNQQLIRIWLTMIPDLKKSLRNSVEFFDIFYRFGKIKKQYAQYLIQKKVVGKLLDLYLDFFQIQNKNFKIAQEEIKKQYEAQPKTEQIDLSQYLGTQNNVDAATNYYDDLLEKKFEKQLNFGPAISRMYLWRTIAYLLKLDGVQVLSQEEQVLLTFDQHFIIQLLEDGDCKLSIRMISDILSCLSYENIKISDNVIGAIIKQVVDKEYKEYRKYLVVLKRIFKIKDSYQNQRIHNGMMKLLDAMNKQQQYFFETDICQQYIIRMCLKNQLVFNWMNKNQKIWSWMHDHQPSQQVPNEKLIQNNSNPSKCSHKLHNIYLPQSQQAYIKYLQWKKQQLLALVKEPFKNVQDFDSDDDISEKVIKPDDKVDYFFTEQNIWISATVTKVMADYIHLQFTTRNSPPNMDIEIDSEKLAPGNTLSINNLIPGYQNEMQIEQARSDHDNDTEEGINNSQQTDSDD